jgi:predicted nucleotidyltransferase
MNKASHERYVIAKQIGQLYAANPNVAAVIVGGSTARGHADRYSDIEMGIFWHQSPSDQERQAVIQRSDADLIGLSDFDPGEQVWCDDFMIGRNQTGQPKTGLLIEVSHYKRDFVKHVLQQVVLEYSTNELWHNLISGIVDAIPLHGEHVVKSWQEQAARFPRELSAAIVQKNGVIDHFWRWEMFLARGDNLPMVYQSFVQRITACYTYCSA